MTKQELMENYTAEQLAEMVLELTWKMWTNSEECKSIPPKVSIIVKCPDCGKPNKIELDEKSECLIRNKLTDRVHELQSEVKKYRKAFEDAKKERDCRVAEYQKKIKELENRDIAEFLPTDPIKVADMLINAEGEYEHNPITKAFCGTDKDTYRIFDVSGLRQIAEHLLVYCNHNGEAEE